MLLLFVKLAIHVSFNKPCFKKNHSTFHNKNNQTNLSLTVLDCNLST